jgi:hypothetical protein
MGKENHHHCAPRPKHPGQGERGQQRNNADYNLDIKAQSIRSDVAVILFHAKFVQDAKEVPVLDRAMIMVAVKQADGWRVAAGQVAKQHEGP